MLNHVIPAGEVLTAPITHAPRVGDVVTFGVTSVGHPQVPVHVALLRRLDRAGIAGGAPDGAMMLLFVFSGESIGVVN